MELQQGTLYVKILGCHTRGVSGEKSCLMTRVMTARLQRCSLSVLENTPRRQVYVFALDLMGDAEESLQHAGSDMKLYMWQQQQTELRR